MRGTYFFPNEVFLVDGEVSVEATKLLCASKRSNRRETLRPVRIDFGQSVRSVYADIETRWMKDSSRKIFSACRICMRKFGGKYRLNSLSELEIDALLRSRTGVARDELSRLSLYRGTWSPKALDGGRDRTSRPTSVSKP